MLIAAELEALARERFVSPPLTTAELNLVRAAVTGQAAMCGQNNNLEDGTNDPSTADLWGAERTIRAELIRWMCVDPHARQLIDPKGIDIFAARISGCLDLFH